MVFLFNLTAIIINLISLAKFLRYFFMNLFGNFVGYDLKIFKLIVVLLMIIAVVVILLPERLIYPNHVAFVIFVALVLFAIIKNLASEKIRNDDIPIFNLAGAPAFIGSQLYSIESIGGLFCIRSTLKHKKSMSTILLLVFSIFFFLFVGLGMNFLFTFSEPKSILFDYYKDDNVIYFFQLAFYFTIPFTLPTYCVSNMLLLEEIGFIKNMLKTPGNEEVLSIFKIKMFRVIATTISLFPIFFGNFIC